VTFGARIGLSSLPFLPPLSNNRELRVVGSVKESVITYIVWIFAMIVMLAGLLAPIVVDAHHWMPRNWWPRRLGRDKRAMGGSQKGGSTLP